jgi:hypothetical protein
LAAFTRLGNLNNTTERFNTDDLAINLTPSLLKAENLTGIRPHEYFYHGLLFVFAHETAHLDRKFPGAFMDIEDLRNWIVEFRRGKILQEEERADAVARRVIVSALIRDKNTNNVLSVYAMIGYFRDLINLKLFEGFRGIAADNRMVSFRYGSCRPELARRRNYREDNIDLVTAGFWNVLPILGKVEYKRFRDDLSKDRATATHEHNFLRSKEILKDLEAAGLGSRWFVPIKPSLGFYGSVLQGRPYLRSDTISGATSLSGRDLLSFLTPQPSLEESPACDVGILCQTGRFEAGSVDLMLYDGKVKYAVIHAPFLEFGNSKMPRLNPQGDGILQKMALSTFFSGRWPRDVTSRRILEELESCGVYSRVIPFDGGIVEITALKAGTVLRFLIYPTSHDILVLN